MNRIISIAAFFLSIALAPWYLSFVIGIFLIAFYRAYVPVITGGLLLDILFGVHIPALGDFAYLYTAFFALLVLTALALRNRMIE